MISKLGITITFVQIVVQITENIEVRRHVDLLLIFAGTLDVGDVVTDLISHESDVRTTEIGGKCFCCHTIPNNLVLIARKFEILSVKLLVKLIFDLDFLI